MCRVHISLPRTALPALPRRKQYYTAALAHQARAGLRAPLCVKARLVDPVALAAETDVAVLLVVAAIERWLTGAVRRRLRSSTRQGNHVAAITERNY
ncbi:MAG: hypothetical protein ACT4NY_10365 [Pseudonocardiales bacterium]